MVESLIMRTGGVTFVVIIALSFVCRAQVGVITTVAGGGPIGVSSGDGGPATSAGIGGPTGVALDAAGNLYIADSIHNLIRKVNSSGIISTYAGGGEPTGVGDGGPATFANLFLIGTQAHSGLAIDSAGNLYIADSGHSRVRKVDAGGIISTVAGNGTTGFSGDGGAATSAQLNTPSGVALDSAGNLYICDQGNGRIRKVTTAGTISTVAGKGNGFTLGDGGPATSGELANPIDVALDSAGNIYIADLGNERIRKVTAGIITSILTEGFGNCGGPLPAASSDVGFGVSLVLDSAGDLFIADHFSNCIHELDSAGTVVTVAGGGTSIPGDGGPATLAQLSQPAGVALDSAGNLYIADSGLGRIQKVTRMAVVTPPVINSGGITNAASFSTTVAPGSIVAVFGTFPIATPTLGGFPLPTAVSGVALQFGSAPLAPLFYGGANQINAQIPWELAGDAQTTVSATLNGQASTPQTVTLAASAPGIFIVNAQTGQGAILDSNYQLVSASNPAMKGSYVQIYCTGLGSVSNQPATGAPAPTVPLASTVLTPTVTMGGVAALVQFSGLTPGEVGLYQINAQVPANAPSGTAEPLIVSINGSVSNTATIAIQ
jgi:uncharacterized protein (TIGR03437 family)